MFSFQRIRFLAALNNKNSSAEQHKKKLSKKSIDQEIANLSIESCL